MVSMYGIVTLWIKVLSGEKFAYRHTCPNIEGKPMFSHTAYLT